MEKENFDRIVEILEDMEYEPQSYSGRGMYGRKCLGVVCNNASTLLLDFVRGAVEVCKQEVCEEDSIYDSFNKLTDLLEYVENPKTDSMARDVIVYWPDIEYQE